MVFLSDLKMYGRFLWGVPGYFRQTITLEDARAIIGHRLEERDSNFLRLIERSIFNYPRSPYRPLMRVAGCEFGDIEDLIRSRGLEKTLLTLKQAGVYVSYEEFKGRQLMIRGGQEIPVTAQDFDNPFLAGAYYGQTGGSTGAGTRIPMDLNHLAAQAPHIMLTHHAHGVLDVPTVAWLGILPDPTGFNNIFRQIRYRKIAEKWFTPIMPGSYRPSFKNRLATLYIIMMGRLLGLPLPWPEPVPVNQAGIIARWAATALKRHGRCLIATQVSRALRICIAAREEGLDLTGAVLWGGGEPPTPTKVREMTRTGARWVPGYWLSEAGVVAQGCTSPEDENDLHFFKDAFALIPYPRQIQGSRITVQAFNFTTLLPTTPKIMLNVESDDYGVIEKRSCGCPLEQEGFTEHLRHIRSFSKLTGEAVTLVGSEMVYVLEEVLPARFGGSSLDYQLLEEEDDDGFTRLSLIVDPKVDISDEAKVIETVFEALRRSSVSANLAQVIWKEANTLRIKRIEPVWTTRGKLMPLHSERRSG